LPLYAYRCTQCGHRFEKIQHFRSEPERVCPVCKGVLERPLTAPRLHFKGPGWYVNDYAAKVSPSTSESALTGAPAESKALSTPKDSTPSTPAAVPAAPAAAAKS
jgi:putative FmdB family regulatory protein